MNKILTWLGKLLGGTKPSKRDRFSRRYVCPYCTHQGRVPKAARGAVIRCSQCNTIFPASPLE